MASSNPSDNEAPLPVDTSTMVEKSTTIPKKTSSQTPQKEHTKTLQDVPKHK
jgi:hypothetical protein